jgi:putative transposase
MAQAYQQRSTSVSLVNYHLVWCPKRRRKILVSKLKTRLEQIIREVCQENACDILALEIMPDHLHLFVNCPPVLAPNQIVKRIKGRSSYLLRKEFPFLLKMPSLWTRSYFVSTAGKVPSQTILRYIAEQKTRD